MALPALIGAAVIGGLAQAATSLVGRVLLALGVSYVSYTGLDVLFSNLQSSIAVNMGAVSGTLYAWMGILKIPTSINIITAAFTTRLTLGAVNGTIKKAILK